MSWILLSMIFLTRIVIFDKDTCQKEESVVLNRKWRDAYSVFLWLLFPMTFMVLSLGLILSIKLKTDAGTDKVFRKKEKK